jgi:hypothetical protein
MKSWTDDLHMYERDDYLLINQGGEIVAVSGNSEFDDIEIPECDREEIVNSRCVIVKVIEYVTVEEEGVYEIQQ